jgi:hypothetical protein
MTAVGRRDGGSADRRRDQTQDNDVCREVSNDSVGSSVGGEGEGAGTAGCVRFRRKRRIAICCFYLSRRVIQKLVVDLTVPSVRST